MVKKSQKRRRHVPASRVAPSAPSASAAAQVPSRPAVAAQAPGRRASATPVEQTPARRPVDLAYEYRYVIGDLKRMGVLAVAMFALLIAASLVAQFVL